MPGQGAQQQVSGINVTESGLIHTCDSQGGGDPQGQFVQFFGEPGDPTQKSSTEIDGGGYPGKVGDLNRRWLRGGKGKAG